MLKATTHSFKRFKRWFNQAAKAQATPKIVSLLTQQSGWNAEGRNPGKHPIDSSGSCTHVFMFLDSQYATNPRSV